jgi:hypothetical protein
MVSAEISLLKGAMSALGQKRTHALQQGMSALPPKADMCGATTDVRSKADIQRDDAPFSIAGFAVLGRSYSVSPMYASSF